MSDVMSDVMSDEMSDVMFTVSQMSGRVRGERGRAWAAPPKEAAGRASRAAVLRQCYDLLIIVHMRLAVITPPDEITTSFC